MPSTAEWSGARVCGEPGVRFPPRLPHPSIRHCAAGLAARLAHVGGAVGRAGCVGAVRVKAQTDRAHVHSGPRFHRGDATICVTHPPVCVCVRFLFWPLMTTVYPTDGFFLTFEPETGDTT